MPFLQNKTKAFLNSADILTEAGGLYKLFLLFTPIKLVQTDQIFQSGFLSIQAQWEGWFHWYTTKIVSNQLVEVHMALYVNTNISSLNAQRQLLTSTLGLNSSFQRLSSGFRINSAADDAAGLQISTRMTSQINGLNQAARNANDGISVAQVAEGAMQESTSMLQRMRELVIQADNGVNSDAERNAIQQEIAQLSLELNRIAETTEFSGKRLLNGDAAGGLNFLVGSRGTAAERIQISIQDMRTDSLGVGATVDGVAVSFNSVSELDVSSNQSSAEQLAVLDAAIQTVGSQRSRLGAVQNRFQSTISNLSNISENVSAARARIMDTDFAAETAQLVRFQIMQQASIAILAQANQRPQAILSLLG